MQMKIKKRDKTIKRQNFVYIFCQQVPRLKTKWELLKPVGPSVTMGGASEN